MSHSSMREINYYLLKNLKKKKEKRKKEMPTMNQAFSLIKQCWFIMVMLGLQCVEVGAN